MKKVSGIYCFENIINGSKYVGQSRNIENRKRGHIRFLRKSKDSCPILQNAWNKYGEENFVFYKVISLPDIDFILNIFERFFIWFLRSHKSMGGYNVSWGGDKPPSRKGMHWSEEEKKKRSDRFKGENNPNYGGKSMTEEQKRVQSIAMSGKNNPHYGESMPQSVREKISKTLTGRHRPKLTDELKKRLSDIKKGKKFTKEHSENIAKAQTGIKKNKTLSKYNGLSIRRGRTKTEGDKWLVLIRQGGVRVRIGIFVDETEAAKIYDSACWYVHHRFELLNFPEDYEGEE